jgi:hypothetical protein
VQTPVGDVHRAATLVRDAARDFVGSYRTWNSTRATTGNLAANNGETKSIPTRWTLPDTGFFSPVRCVCGTPHPESRYSLRSLAFCKRATAGGSRGCRRRVRGAGVCGVSASETVCRPDVRPPRTGDRRGASPVLLGDAHHETVLSTHQEEGSQSWQPLVLQGRPRRLTSTAGSTSLTLSLAAQRAAAPDGWGNAGPLPPAQLCESYGRAVLPVWPLAMV